MIWTDRIRQVKILLVVAAVLIAVASLVVSHFLVRDLAQEERSRMEVWAEAMRSLNMADENTDLQLVLKVINENNTIPVIVLDPKGNAQLFRNIKVDGTDYNDSLAHAAVVGRHLLAKGKNIKIMLNDSTHDYIQVCYGESVMITRLAAYPMVQLGGGSDFCRCRYICFAYVKARRTEQGLGRLVEGNCPSVGYAHLQFDGLDRNIEGDLS